eukprot:UN34435
MTNFGNKKSDNIIHIDFGLINNEKLFIMIESSGQIHIFRWSISTWKRLNHNKTKIYTKYENTIIHNDKYIFIQARTRIVNNKIECCLVGKNHIICFF